MATANWEFVRSTRNFTGGRAYQAFANALDASECRKLERLLRTETLFGIETEEQAQAHEKELRDTVEYLQLLVSEELARIRSEITAHSLVDKIGAAFYHARCPFCESGVMQWSEQWLEDLLVYERAYAPCRCTASRLQHQATRTESMVYQVMAAKASGDVPLTYFGDGLQCVTVTAIVIDGVEVGQVVAVSDEHLRTAVTIDRRKLIDANAAASAIIVNDFAARQERGRIERMEDDVVEGLLLRLYIVRNDDSRWCGIGVDGALYVLDREVMPEIIGTLEEGWYYCKPPTKPGTTIVRMYDRVRPAHQPALRPAMPHSGPEVISVRRPR